MRWTLFFLMILSTNLAFAAPSINFQHEEITKGETIFATVDTSGEFTEQISSSDISFYEGRKKIFIESDILFFNKTHYIYAYTTRTGNFTVRIPNVLYDEGSGLKSIDLEKSFEVKSAVENSSTLSIKPGFFFTTENSAMIQLTNKNNKVLDIEYLEEKINLSQDQTYEINFQPKTPFSYLEIQTYKTFRVPIIFAKINQTTPPEELSLKSDPSSLTAELIEKQESTKTIELFNFGDENITNLKINSDITFLETSTLENLPARTVHNLTITLKPKNSGHLNGFLNITYDQYGREHVFSLALDLFTLPNGSTTEDFKVTSETCVERNGKLCSSNEFCDGKSGFAKDGYCCFNTCKPRESGDENGSSIGLIIGIIIFAILGGVGFWIYRRSKKAKPKKPEEKLKEASSDYAKRITGGVQRS